MTSSSTGGVKPMNIAGRMVNERERLLGMSDAERAWRAQWLKDQILAPDEPIEPKGYYEARYNILRRFYRAPLNILENALVKPLGPTSANTVRHLIAKTGLGFVGACYIWYHFKYNRSDWTRKSSWKVTTSRTAVYPGDPGFPNYKQKKDNEYASFGFTESPI